jgi:hypothetical protein
VILGSIFPFTCGDNSEASPLLGLLLVIDEDPVCLYTYSLGRVGVILNSQRAVTTSRRQAAVFCMNTIILYPNTLALRKRIHTRCISTMPTMIQFPNSLFSVLPKLAAVDSARISRVAARRSVFTHMLRHEMFETRLASDQFTSPFKPLSYPMPDSPR